MMKEQVGGDGGQNQGGLVVWRWEGKREEGWFWFVFDRSQKGSGLGLNFGLGWAFGVTGQRIS